ncbi:hypothetical protein [Vibrio pectenicida]|uniref:DUF4760 domain-containing protein n=1 Tax=Vibrio pectenicida TaxID=62763 RepID=A0A427U546_9VIBR|nr:hypothetical protein [Vibrio pectenicida]RSD31750.1 hypothetical protein EJA03_07440 [Vibrio pectenicida]
MKEWKEWVTIAVLILIFAMASYWFATTNPLKFSLQDVRDVLRQVFVYSFAAGVAIFGYWWTQREQDRRHDDQLYEARWNKTLDIQFEALEKLSSKRLALYSELRKVSKLYLFQFITDDEFRDLKLYDFEEQISWQSNHTSFYLSHDDFYLMDITFEMTAAIDELESYCNQVLPLPKDASIELEELVALSIRQHFNKILSLSLVLDWEIGCLIKGKVLDRYDLDLDDDNQWDKQDDTETYLQWKERVYKQQRKYVGLTNTNVILNERNFTECDSSEDKA